MSANDLGLGVIDAGRMGLVDGYVADAARGMAGENPGLTWMEQDAFRLVVDHERREGRGLVGDGAVRAASRMLDNAWGADDGAWELAALMASDLAMQRHAAAVLTAGEAFGRDGSLPAEGTFPDVIARYVLPDIAEDPDAAADWRAMAEGRFHDVSRMSEDIVSSGVRDFEHLPEEARHRIHDEAAREDEPEPRPRLLDALDMAEMHEASARVGRDPYGIAESMEGAADRHASMLRESRDPKLLLAEVDDLLRSGVPMSKDVARGADVLGRMVAGGDDRTDDFARSLAEAVLDARGASAGAAQAWTLMDGEHETLATALLRDAVEQQERTPWKGGFEHARMEMATGPDADAYRPFRAPTHVEHHHAEDEIRTLVDAARMRDETVFVDPGLSRAVDLLVREGLIGDVQRMPEHVHEALAGAFARAHARDAVRGPMTSGEMGRLIAYDVATQEEARGLSAGTEAGVGTAARAGGMVGRMGIRTLREEHLSDADLAMAAVGRYEMVSEYHRAGIDLGMAWASDDHANRRLFDRIPGPEVARGILAQAAAMGSAPFAAARGPEEPRPAPAMATGRTGRE